VRASADATNGYSCTCSPGHWVPFAHVYRYHTLFAACEARCPRAHSVCFPYKPCRQSVFDLSTTAVQNHYRRSRGWSRDERTFQTATGTNPLAPTLRCATVG
jgi:hypothetical protein